MRRKIHLMIYKIFKELILEVIPLTDVYAGSICFRKTQRVIKNSHFSEDSDF